MAVRDCTTSSERTVSKQLVRGLKQKSISGLIQLIKCSDCVGLRMDGASGWFQHSSKPIYQGDGLCSEKLYEPIYYRPSAPQTVYSRELRVALRLFRYISERNPFHGWSDRDAV